MMVSVEEAQQLLFSFPLKCDVEQISISKALHRILAEPILADRDFPPYNRVAMDGIAVNMHAIEQGHRNLKVEATVAAGQAQYRLKDDLCCVEIMTGAVLPVGCDTVIRYENIEIKNGQAAIHVPPTKQGENVHRQGSDRKQGSTIVSAPIPLSAAELGIAATVGKSELQVFKVPPICLISTGNELVGIDENPEPHQIRSSNAIALAAALSRWSTLIDHQHLPDDHDLVRTAITNLLTKYQILIFMGGSSMGKYDFIPSTLKEAGVREIFYKILQRPGKPMWFGGDNNQFVFALPGNPVSAYLCVERYLHTWFRNSLGLPQPIMHAILQRTVEFKPNLSYFLQVRLYNENGSLYADPVPGAGSGDHANLTDVDAFLELPRGRDLYKKGEHFPIYRFKPST